SPTPAMVTKKPCSPPGRRGSPSVATAHPRRSPASSSSSAPTPRPMSPAPPSTSTAASAPESSDPRSLQPSWGHFPRRLQTSSAGQEGGEVVERATDDIVGGGGHAQDDFGDAQRAVVLELALGGERAERHDLECRGVAPGLLECGPQLGQD